MNYKAIIIFLFLLVSISTHSSDELVERNIESIRAGMEKNKDKIHEEWERIKEIYGELHGKYSVSFAIEPDGTLSEVELQSSTLGSTGADTRLLNVIKALKFKESKSAAVKVSYTFAFFND